MNWKDTKSKSEMMKCAQCGKEFFAPVVGEWCYKKAPSTTMGRNAKFFCSWSCLRAFEKREEEEEIKRYGRKMRHQVKHG